MHFSFQIQNDLIEYIQQITIETEYDIENWLNKYFKNPQNIQKIVQQLIILINLDKCKIIGEYLYQNPTIQTFEVNEYDKLISCIQNKINSQDFKFDIYLIKILLFILRQGFILNIRFNELISLQTKNKLFQLYYSQNTEQENIKKELFIFLNIQQQQYQYDTYKPIIQQFLSQASNLLNYDEIEPQKLEVCRLLKKLAQSDITSIHQIIAFCILLQAEQVRINDSSYLLSNTGIQAIEFVMKSGICQQWKLLIMDNLIPQMPTVWKSQMPRLCQFEDENSDIQINQLLISRIKCKFYLYERNRKGFDLNLQQLIQSFPNDKLITKLHKIYLFQSYLISCNDKLQIVSDINQSIDLIQEQCNSKPLSIQNQVNIAFLQTLISYLYMTKQSYPLLLQMFNSEYILVLTPLYDLLKILMIIQQFIIYQQNLIFDVLDFQQHFIHQQTYFQFKLSNIQVINLTPKEYSFEKLQTENNLIKNQYMKQIKEQQLQFQDKIEKLTEENEILKMKVKTIEIEENKILIENKQKIDEIKQLNQDLQEQYQLNKQFNETIEKNVNQLSQFNIKKKEMEEQIKNIQQKVENLEFEKEQLQSELDREKTILNQIKKLIQ